MAETQHVKSFEMRLNTRCLWSVVVCNGNRRSWSQLRRVLDRVLILCSRLWSMGR